MQGTSIVLFWTHLVNYEKVTDFAFSKGACDVISV